jgi:hypothetical protein
MAKPSARARKPSALKSSAKSQKPSVKKSTVPKSSAKSSRPTAKVARPAAKARAAPRASTSAGVDPGAPGETAYTRFLSAAEAVPAVQVKELSVDALAAFHNVEVGVRAVLGVRDALDARIRKIDWAALEGLPALARAVCFAASQVEAAPLPVVGLADKLAEARKLRGVLLKKAELLAATGHLPAAAVEKIREGHGFIDTANDCIALAALFRRYATKLADTQAVTPEQLARAGELGAELATSLALDPRLAKKNEETPAPSRATDTRDRLWTLLLHQHRELRRLGAFHWVDDVDRHVPPLEARRAVA